MNREKTHDLLARLIDRIATNSNDQAAEMIRKRALTFCQRSAPRANGNSFF